MSNLDRYVEKLKEYVQNHPDLTETELVMYVYLSLGKRFKFEPEYFFGNSKNRDRLYQRAASIRRN